MKIAYVARHQNGRNDDEGAIAYSLESLGHEVLRIQENTDYSSANRCDFVLMHHHWTDPGKVCEIKRPRVFWLFDLVDHPKLPGRLTEHVHKLLGITNLGFCTDGDFAALYPMKLRHLPQGADERCAGRWNVPDDRGILFMGNTKFPASRKIFLKRTMLRYQRQLTALTDPRSWVYREALARIINSHKITIALPDPVKDFYWSNRVYITCGFGGVLVHPYCYGLTEHYANGREIFFYRNEQEFHSKVSLLLENADLREEVRKNALERTLQEHTYTHRCKTLIKAVEENIHW